MANLVPMSAGCRWLRWSCWALAVLLSAACSRGAQLPAGWTTVESTAFQAEHAVEIGEATGPLSTVASHYVGMGQALTLGLVDGAIVADPSPVPEFQVRVEVSDAGPRCVQGCGPKPVTVTAHQQVSLGHFSLSLSPQSGTLRILVHDPQSAALRAFEGLSWFPVDAGFIVPARWEPASDLAPVQLSTSRGLTKSFVRAGTLRARLLDQDITLTGYQAGPEALLVPLTDQTTGTTSYPVGRYLEVPMPKDGIAVLDFNRLTNPWCAYSEHYNCPVPPSENALSVSVTAGEQIYAAH